MAQIATKLIKSDGVVNLSLDEIEPDTFMMRAELENIDELAESIRSLGLLEPLIVRRGANGKYQLLAGHRRYEACKRVGLKRVKAIVVDASDKDAFLIALAENVQKKSLNPIEEAVAYRNYIHRKGWGGVSELARNIGKSPSYISIMVRLLELPEEIQGLIRSGKLKPFVAAELERVKDKEKLNRIVNLINAKRPSLRKLREIIYDYDGYKGAKEENLDEDDAYVSALKSMEASVRQCLINFDIVINRLGENNKFYQNALKHRYRLHGVLDEIIKERVRIKRGNKEPN